MRKNTMNVEVNITGRNGKYKLTKEAIYSLFRYDYIPNRIDGEPPFTWLMKTNFELLIKITNTGDLDELLTKAVSTNDVKGTKYYLKRGATAWLPGNICVATYFGDTEIVKMLINAGANPNAEDGYPLQVASAKGFTDIVKILIATGAKVDLVDNYAIKQANKNKYYDIVAILEENGAKLTD